MTSLIKRFSKATDVFNPASNIKYIQYHRKKKNQPDEFIWYSWYCTWDLFIYLVIYFCTLHHSQRPQRFVFFFFYDRPAPYREIQMFLVKGTQNKANEPHNELEANSSQVARSRHKFIPKPYSSYKCFQSTTKKKKKPLHTNVLKCHFHSPHLLSE